VSVEQNIATTKLIYDYLANGRKFDADFAHIITLRDGKWLFFRDCFNSAVASAAFRE
jgi:ketosteroid isomerase-like protein